MYFGVIADTTLYVMWKWPFFKSDRFYEIISVGVLCDMCNHFPNDDESNFDIDRSNYSDGRPTFNRIKVYPMLNNCSMFNTFVRTAIVSDIVRLKF